MKFLLPEKNRIVKISVCLYGILLFSFLPAHARQQGYEINGKIHQKDVQKIYLSYQYNSINHIDSAEVKNGVYQLKGKLPEVLLCTLYTHKNGPIRIFIAENAKISMESPASGLTASSITGAPANEVYAAYKKDLFNLPAKRPAKTGDEQGDKTKFSIYIKEFNRQKDSLMLSLLKAHPESAASAIAIMELYVTAPDTLKARRYFNMLHPEIQRSQYGKRVLLFVDAARVTALNQQAPEISLADPGGKIHRLSAFRGQYVLIDFWASWCVPCRKEVPYLKDTYDTYHQQGFTILSISLDADAGQWKTAVEQDQLYWMQLNDSKSTNGETADLYGVKSLPANFLVDPQGKIVARNLRGDRLKEMVAAFMSK